jgi:hypothetical protein
LLIAEIHGKSVPEARNFEDYLTSAVFGHLRYVSPAIFWETLFETAVSQQVESRVITANEQIRRKAGRSLSSFDNLAVVFWPEHRNGIPDLILHFYGSESQSVVILIEAKLTAGKSGAGEKDQLARYLRILDSLDGLRPPLPCDAVGIVVYLTATDSRTEIIESLRQYGDNCDARMRLFHMQWQDVIRAIDETITSSEPEAMILKDIRRFLCKRGLEYFSGMEDSFPIPAAREEDGDFLKDERLFDAGSIPIGLGVINERWIHAN